VPVVYGWTDLVAGGGIPTDSSGSLEDLPAGDLAG
jgi:hypothetical protein